MIYDVIILGGGIAGLYTAYKILQISSHSKILILEKENYLGGRIYTFRNKHMEVDAGAGRFSEKHTLLIELIKELGLSHKINKLSSEALFIRSGENGKTLDSIFDAPDNPTDEQNNMNRLLSQDPQLLNESMQPLTKIGLDVVLGEYTQPGAAIIAKILIASKSESLIDLTQLTFIEYAEKVVSPEEVQFIKDTFGYYSELVIMNAYDACLLMDTLSPLNQFYNLKGGMDILIHKLEHKLKSFPHLKIIKNKTVEQITFSHPNKTLKGGKTPKTRKHLPPRQNIHHILCSDGIQYHGVRCVSALPKNAIEKMKIFKPIRHLLEKIVCGSLCRIYSKYKPNKETGKMWFESMKKSTVDNQLRIIIPIDVKKGIIMVSYTDNIYAEYWRKIYEKKGTKGVDAEIKVQMKMATGIDIPDPVDTQVFYWKCGVGYWGVGANSKLISENLTKPYPGQELYICGESYSHTGQQWIEGALETSKHVLRKLFDKNDILCQQIY